jgi:hypothetical protein
MAMRFDGIIVALPVRERTSRITEHPLMAGDLQLGGRAYTKD